MKKIKKKKPYLKVVLTSMFVVLLLYTAASLYVTYKTGVEPSTLNASVFAFCSVEGGLGAWIKLDSRKKEVQSNDNSNAV